MGLLRQRSSPACGVIIEPECRQMKWLAQSPLTRTRWWRGAAVTTCWLRSRESVA